MWSRYVIRFYGLSETVYPPKRERKVFIYELKNFPFGRGQCVLQNSIQLEREKGWVRVKRIELYVN